MIRVSFLSLRHFGVTGGAVWRVVGRFETSSDPHLRMLGLNPFG